MSQKQPNEKYRNNPAFEVVEVNIKTGETTVVIQKGIIGPIANQLRNTNDHIKGARIVRKLGYVLSACGDIQYGTKEVEETDINPALVTGNSEHNVDITLTAEVKE